MIRGANNFFRFPTPPARALELKMASRRIEVRGTMPQNATSTKPPAIKAKVIALYAEGQSKARIARKLGIDRETVTRILDEPEIKEAVEASRSRCIALLPKAEQAVERQLDEGDGDLALRLLEKSGVFAGEPHFSFHDDSQLQIAINTLLSPAALPAAPQAHLNGNGTAALALMADTKVSAESSGVEAVAVPLVSTQASRPSEPINIVTGRHDKWCRCRDCRSERPVPHLAVSSGPHV